MVSSLSGLCPECGTPGLFAGLTQFSEQCPGCGLDYRPYNVGDGPAAFLILLWGTIICSLALALHFVWRPPFWVHALLWLPLTSIGVVWSLRVSKAAMLITEHRKQVREGRLVETDEQHGHHAPKNTANGGHDHSDHEPVKDARPADQDRAS